MYNVIKSVIESGRYELSDMLRKIDTVWIQGDITDAEKAQLIDLARGNANTTNSIEIYAKLEEHEKRIKALENGKTPEPTDEYPPYEVGKWYCNGDKVSFDGKNYTCTAPEGVVCVWSPSEYPAYWELVV